MENLKTMEGKIKAILKKDEETRDEARKENRRAEMYLDF